MSTDMPVSLVIPLYMEVARFGDYLDELLAFVAAQPAGSELILVDDGSTDGTAERVEQFLAARDATHARVLRRPHRGKGAAVRAGLEAARGDIGAFCDVDLSTSLTDLATLIDAARAKPVLAIGSRDLPSSRLVRPQGRVREFLGRSYNRAVQFALVPGIVDTQCGAKAAPMSLWRTMLPHSAEDGFAWDVEIIALARSMGYPVQEFAVSWRHDARSRINVGRDGVRMLRALPRIHRHVREVTAERADARAGGEVFEGALADDLAESDASHWWFRSKASFVSFALRRFDAPEGWLVDVGAGAAGVTAILGWGLHETLAIEGSSGLVQAARSRYALEAARADVTALPLADASVSVVCLLDVIEHLSDPAPALAEARRVLAPGGRLIVTVPAHPWLWSAMDEAIGHRCRYNRRLARGQVEEAGLDVLWCSHIFSWLVPPVWVKRRGRAGADAEFGLDVTSPVIDRLALLLTRLESLTLGRIALPVGTSVLCVATKR